MNDNTTQDKALSDFAPQYSCRVHPTDYWDEVGCPHKQWTVEQLQEALNRSKQSNAYLIYMLGKHGPGLTTNPNGDNNV